MKFQGSENYVATQDLMLAVNAAATLQRPLLVKGEPGTGKTMLAEEVAAALDRSEEHTSELQSPCNLVCRLLLEKKKNRHITTNEYLCQNVNHPLQYRKTPHLVPSQLLVP